MDGNAVFPDMGSDHFRFFFVESSGPVPGFANEEVYLHAMVGQAFDQFDSYESSANNSCFAA